MLFFFLYVWTGIACIGSAENAILRKHSHKMFNKKIVEFRVSYNTVRKQINRVVSQYF